jgi:3-methylfumaryl-CoA hydratase
LLSIEYSNRAATYIGETLTSGGTVTAVDQASGEVRVEVFVKNAAGEVVTPGVATALLEAQ